MTLHRLEARTAILLVAIAFLPHAYCARRELVLRWEEVGAAVGNRAVTVELVGGKRVRGVIISTESDGLRMDLRSASGKLAPISRAELVSRKDILAIRIKETKGHPRLIAATAIGAAVSLGSLPWALSESRVDVSDTSRIGQWVAISSAGVAGGYWIGRLIDRKETIVRIAP